MDASHCCRLRTHFGWTDDHFAINAQLRSEGNVAALLRDGDDERLWRHTFNLAERIVPQLPARRSLVEPAVDVLTQEDIEELCRLLGITQEAPRPRRSCRKK